MKWIRESLGEICRKGNGRIQTGPFGSQLHESDYSPDGIPVVMPADIDAGKITTRRIARVPERHVERLSRHKLAIGDIVYGRRGDIGRQALVRSENQGWLCGTGCLKISLGSGPLSPEFLHRYLATSSVVGWIEGQAVGATMPNLNTGILERIPVAYPASREAQEQIAAILSAYDDLIENNRQRIALLEKMAEEIYREWFVRLRFPGHEQAKFEKGRPVEWRETTLGDVLELAYGKALKEEDRIAGRVKVFGSGGLVGYHNAALVSGPGIIVGRKGNVGAVYWSDDSFFPIDTVYFVRSEIDMHFLYYLLQSMNFLNNDAAVPGLNRNQAYANRILLPSNNLLLAFGDKARAIFQTKRTLATQTDLLVASRDALLPRLISGKLPVDALDVRFPSSMQLK